MTVTLPIRNDPASQLNAAINRGSAALLLVRSIAVQLREMGMAISRAKVGAGLLVASALVAGHQVLAQQLPRQCRTPALARCLLSADRDSCAALVLQNMLHDCKGYQ
ncbi:hypothetical protein OMW55_10220 [Sphingomonas sp. BN140010]|uniref:Uncharacterized protein n=1 Tax=Sphingomonas arvum TaxID=2992113 RepID=A0ABT3JGP1_9SPHN|nr:hypothetical protein [Sphingomonas sp. BN140010]MCW3798179.1 hypothetical protein [Sphingomonas sp. BN140010]